VGALTPSDVKRWDVDAIHAVFQTASGRAATLQRLGENLNRVDNVLADWQGEAGEAFRVDLGKARRDIEADGAESRQVAAAVSRAEADVRACKAELDGIERAADANGWTITPDWRIDVGNTGIGLDPIGFAAEQQALQDELDACKVHAQNADHELATAIRGAVGEVRLDSTGNPPGGAPPPQGPRNPADPRGNSPSLQDMLLPTGAGDGDPARMPRSLEDMLIPTGAGAGVPGYKPRSLKDLLLPSDRTDPSDEQPLPGSLPDLLSRLHQPVAPGAASPQLKSADVESFRVMLRPIMARDGVPADQIEAQLNAAVANAQKWLDDGMPNYVAAEPPRPPPPGLGEGFGDRWFATEQGIKNLIGQGGPGATGVLDSWEQMLKGTTEIATNPAGALIGEVKNAFDSPSLSYYLGEKACDGVFALPGLFFGGEGAAVEAGLPAEAVTEGGAPLALVRGWDPTGGMPWDDFASRFGTPETRNYPLNDGFPPGYVPQTAQLPEGAIIDRFGSVYGRYLAPDGTPFADRALAPESVEGDYNRYMVTGEPLPPGWQIVEGPVEPWYGQTPPPAALQYMLLGPDGVKPTVHDLVRLGILDEYGPPLGR
jgi:uncharacterized protein YukE